MSLTTERNELLKPERVIAHFLRKNKEKLRQIASLHHDCVLYFSCLAMVPENMIMFGVEFGKSTLKLLSESGIEVVIRYAKTNFDAPMPA